AEDGIRADLVTGVQTCALPISEHEVEPPIFTTRFFIETHDAPFLLLSSKRCRSLSFPSLRRRFMYSRRDFFHSSVERISARWHLLEQNCWCAKRAKKRLAHPFRAHGLIRCKSPWRASSMQLEKAWVRARSRRLAGSHSTTHRVLSNTIFRTFCFHAGDQRWPFWTMGT